MSSAPTEPDGVTVNVPEEQVLTFVAAGERYASPILDVREIRRWEPPTRVPHASRYVLGVLNVRGEIIPIVDLRGLMRASGTSEYGKTTITILFSVARDDGARQVGLVVDELAGVCHVPHDLRSKPPEASDPHVSSIATLPDGEMLLLLDLEKIVESFCVADDRGDG